MKLLIINGPNLNLLGHRQPDVYGSMSMEQYLPRLRSLFPQIAIEYVQSNHEGAIIDALHGCGYPEKSCDGIILNAGAYTHTSLAIADAIASIDVPVVEVHISNIAAREPIRHQSLIAGVCRGSIAGFGMDSYRLAVESFITRP
ncbi:MAG: type II 3-dehydroquinate dehydratase [Firmicutes bacterium]|nr:type II 3-dehydroquinate dehydratase [Bacillota bacterium]MCM1400576.1 type II 3-dehydroquinate dehydratase [Bacteroides sp.]MCM1476480.1 type II 3-dehydroquinate dehydratase [Bacteroides sp.]